MKLIDILTHINPILRILLVIVLAVATNFTVKTIRRFSQYLLTMKVDSNETSKEILTRRYPKLATIITILVSAVTFTIYFVAVGMILREFKISRMSSMVNGVMCASSSSFGRDRLISSKRHSNKEWSRYSKNPMRIMPPG
jgi:small-conductance mechanosensitive channel